MFSKEDIKAIQGVAKNNARTSRSTAFDRIIRFESFCDPRSIKAFRNALKKNVQIRSKIKKKKEFNRLQKELKSNFINPAPFINAVNNTVPTIKDISSELGAIKKEFKRVWVSDTHIVVETDYIIIEDIHFGKFNIYLDKKLLNSSWLDNNFPISVLALSPIHPKGVMNASRITHPHVMRNVLCKGEAGSALTNALINCQIFDYFFIINSILENYSDTHPFATIERWKTSLCSFCNEYEIYAESGSCADCEMPGCENCIKKCLTCSTNICERKHSSFCSRCGSIICAVECVRKCIHCNDTFCDRCGSYGDEFTCKYCRDEEL